MNLQEAMALVEEGWKFTPDKYPGLYRLPIIGEETTRFAISHVNLHFQKSAGALGALVEQWDHGKDGGEEESIRLRSIAIKQVINSLRLVRLVGLHDFEVAHEITAWATERIPGLGDVLT